MLVAAGLWPVLHRRSYEAVTGHKQEGWLLKCLGLALAAMGASEIVAARRDAVGGATKTLGVGSAAALAAIDLLYVGKKRIRPVYLVDAAVQLGTIVAWRAASHAKDEGPAASNGHASTIARPL